MICPDIKIALPAADDVISDSKEGLRRIKNKMANLFDYIDWRGDVPFEMDPFHEVDNLVLSECAYVDFEGVLPGGGIQTTITMKEAAERYFTLHSEQEVLSKAGQTATVPLLLKKAGESCRFGGVRIGGYVNMVSKETSEQMAAMTFLLETPIANEPDARTNARADVQTDTRTDVQTDARTDVQPDARTDTGAVSAGPSAASEALSPGSAKVSLAAPEALSPGSAKDSPAASEALCSGSVKASSAASEALCSGSAKASSTTSEALSPGSVKASSAASEALCSGSVKDSSATPAVHSSLVAYVAFRGTDDSLVGWKEDFCLSFMEETPGQKHAAQYLDVCLRDFDGPVMVGGHSKGGNFALYGAAFCDEDTQSKIIKVYTNDSPGFVESIVAKESYQSILPKVFAIITEESIFGRLLNYGFEPSVVVKSEKKGLAAHNALSWQVLRNHFVEAEKLSFVSSITKKTLTDWLKKIDYDRRERFVDVLFEMLTSGNASTLSGLNRDTIRNKLDMVLSFRSLDPQDQKLMLQVFGELLKSGWNTIDTINKVVTGKPALGPGNKKPAAITDPERKADGENMNIEKK